MVDAIKCAGSTVALTPPPLSVVSSDDDTFLGSINHKKRELNRKKKKMYLSKKKNYIKHIS